MVSVTLVKPEEASTKCHVPSFSRTKPVFQMVDEDVYCPRMPICGMDTLACEILTKLAVKRACEFCTSRVPLTVVLPDSVLLPEKVVAPDTLSGLTVEMLPSPLMEMFKPPVVVMAESVMVMVPADTEDEAFTVWP